MKLGTGIAIAGIWFGVALAAFSNVTDIATTVGVMSIGATIASVFIALFTSS